MKARNENVRNNDNNNKPQNCKHFSRTAIYILFCSWRVFFCFAYASAHCLTDPRPIPQYTSTSTSKLFFSSLAVLVARPTVRAREYAGIYNYYSYYIFAAQVYAIADNNSPFNVFGFWWLTARLACGNSYLERRILFLLLPKYILHSSRILCLCVCARKSFFARHLRCHRRSLVLDLSFALYSFLCPLWTNIAHCSPSCRLNVYI